MRVFISYRREDSAGHTGRLYDALQARFGADNVFLDRSAIDAGQNFAEAISTAIQSCDALVAVIGNQWLTCAGAAGRRLEDPADFVRVEIAAALERGIPVIPVLVEGTPMPDAAALPDVLTSLARRHALELSDARWSYDVGRLIQALEKITGTERGWTRHTRVAAAAAAALAIVAGALLLLRAPTQPDPESQDAGAYVSRGTEFLTRGDYDRAIGEFNRAIELDPRAESYYNRGFAYYSKKDVDRAIADWNTAINLDPRDARSYRQRGNAYVAKGDYSLAVADYNRAIELDPNDARAHYNRGLVFKARGEPAKAAADFTTVLALANDSDARRDAQTRLDELGSTSPPRRASRDGASADPVTSDGSPPQNASLAGDWSAEVKYDWGDAYTERFAFKLDGNDVVGTASFLGTRRGILDGRLSGNSVTFRTRTQEVIGDWNNPRDVVHHYRGRIAGDTITFFMQSEGARSSAAVEFTATRVPAGTTTQAGQRP